MAGTSGSIKPKDKKYKKVVLFGQTGDGKLTVANVLVAGGPMIFESSDAARGCTSSIQYSACLMREISTNEFKTDTNFEFDGASWRVIEFLHAKPGKGATFVRSGDQFVFMDMELSSLGLPGVAEFDD